MLIELVLIATILVVLYINFLHIILWEESKKEIIKNKIKILPSVSIIVPAHNEEGNISRIINNIANLNYPKEKIEVILIDDGSSDATYEIMKKEVKKMKRKNEAKKISWKILKNNARLGKATSLNKGIRIARKRFVAVIDADSKLHEDALYHCMLRFFDDGKENLDVAAVTSNILVDKNSRLLQKLQNIEFMLIASLRKLQERLNIIMATPGPLSVFRRDVLLKLGGFDESNLTEDIEIAWRLLAHNYKIRMAFDAKVWSDYPATLKKWWKQRTRWNLGGFQTLLKYIKEVRKNPALRKFIIPYSLAGYLLTTLGVFIAIYLFYNAIANFLDYFFEALRVGINPISRISFRYAIDVFTIFGVFVFSTSLYLLYNGIKMQRKTRVKKIIKNAKLELIPLIIFITFYIMLFPIVLVYSLFKFILLIKEGDIKKAWLTK
ncbi:MAG: glycosyltransferase family 2 protein [Candidatus Aenigmatarchaeota archaeon]